MSQSWVRDLSLAPAGAAKIRWAAEHMPLLRVLRDREGPSQPLKGRRVAAVLHLEAKTAVLILLLRDLGARVAVAGSNPLSTQDDVAAALAAEGVEVYARRGVTEEEYRELLARVAATEPELVIDDGADLIALLHTRMRHLLPRILGGAEETTTGVRRLRALAADGKLAFPVVAVNDARMKFLFDNRYGTGQSVWDAIMRTTNLVVAGKHVVVAGYGWCGKGVALRARGLGARVTVCEVDPIAANEALMDGFAVMPLRRAAATADVVVTVTGMRDVVRREHLLVMRSGVLLANAGHFDVEIDVASLRAMAVARREVRPGVSEYELPDGRRIHLLAEGRLVNLASGDGHPVEIMDMSFALQALSLLHLVRQAGQLAPGVHPVPESLDREVAAMRLAALGVEIDRLTRRQKAYLHAWEEGT